ncbi:MAG: hypothetical protein ABJA80_09665 [bacterium]
MSPFTLIAARDVEGFELGIDRTDVRAWPVFSADARLVGNVDAMYLDPMHTAIRYLGISLGSPGDSTGPLIGRVMVPVGSARRHGLRRRLILNHLTASQLATAPRLRNRRVTRTEEQATLYSLGLALPGAPTNGSRYDSALFEEAALFAGDRVPV